jgi:4-amino-4-deoxy-L-arabinose transferase-like glycosyltransferase
MQITGFPAVEALQYSHQLLTPVKWGILSGQLIFLLGTEALLVACAWFLPEFVIFTVWTTALFTLLLLFYCVRMQIAYFDRDHIERADLRRYY